MARIHYYKVDFVVRGTTCKGMLTVPARNKEYVKHIIRRFFKPVRVQIKNVSKIDTKQDKK